MRYGILGPLSVMADGRPVAITAGRDRVVLAMLLLHAGRVLSVGALIEAVWDADPPNTARGQLQTCVSRLRRILPAGAIESDPVGYRLVAGPDAVDAVVFGRLIADARRQGDRLLYRRALDLWRGDALPGTDSHSVRTAASALDQQRVTAVEEWAELELAAAQERSLIGELAPMVERFPLQERLRGQLIRALAHAGRAGDALAEYRRVHALLRDELGLEPGRELQELHRRILEGEAVTVPQEPSPVRGLPRTVNDFTGRGDIVDRLLSVAESPGPVLLALDGMAGSGKTTLALHLAKLVGDRYPDAHLFVDLHGHSDRAPLDPAAALLILLRQLGIDADQVPDDREARVERWRNELAKRRVLLILDNAASSEQIADLLPASPETLAFVTSRRPRWTSPTRQHCSPGSRGRGS
jgi:DNA-binding SARP family transcriptional activator